MKNSIWTDFLHLFYPRLCLLCEEPLVEGEEQICLNCLCDLPRVWHQEGETWESLFVGKSDIKQAYAFYVFEKGGHVQQLIHALKYYDNKELAYSLGSLAFRTLLYEKHPICDFDVLLPVPLHPKRLQERGYNQAEWIAKGIQSVLSAPINTSAVTRKVKTETQTHRNVYDRWTNMQEVFELVESKELENRKVLLIDDVLTTGATFNACAAILENVPGIQLSAFALAKV